jgi:arylsulfatase A-like enzyme
MVQDNPAMSIDLLPTISKITGAKLPELPIDGRDISGMLKDKGIKSPQEAYFIYYNRNELQAMVMDEWKLYFPHKYRVIAPDQEPRNDGFPLQYTMTDVLEMELYHLPNDPGESVNVLYKHPDVLEKMMKIADKAREDMGDALLKKEGENSREPGRKTE